MKDYLTLPKVPGVEPSNQMPFSVILRTLVSREGILSLCRGAVSVFYTSSRWNNFEGNK